MATEVTITAYGGEALRALRAAVARVKQDDAMAPVTVVVPNNIAGIVARRHLARGLTDEGNGVAGIWFTTLPRLAEQLAAPTLTRHGRRPATRPVKAAAIREVLTTNPGAFAPVATHPTTARALSRASAHLKDVDEEALSTIARGSTLAADVVRLHREAVTALTPAWYDTVDLLAAATRLVPDRPDWVADLGTLVVYLPQDLTRHEATFAAAVTAAAKTHVVAALTGNTRADQGALDAIAIVAPGFIPPPREQARSARVLNASDSDDEVRCVVREVVTRLQTTPAHRIAVLYTARSPYARLLHEHLDSAGITVNGPGVRPVDERATSRLILGLLEVARTGYRRSDVLRVLGELSVRDFTGDRISTTRWERVSREAGVVEGDHWQTRLTSYARHQQQSIDEPGADESTISRAERNREAADGLNAFVTELQQRFDTASSASTWGAMGSSTAALIARLLPAPDRRHLPLEEQYAAGVIDRILAGLAALDSGQMPPSLALLEEVVALELESALPRVGRFGEGVIVAPITHVVGLDLDAVYVVGLAEDLYLGRLRDDSLLPERIRGLTPQLPSIRAGLDVKHRALLGAFDSAPEVVATFPRGDLRRHTHRLPCRWLLPTLRHLSGKPELAATDYEQGSQTWLESSPSYAGSLLGTPAPSTEQEWRIRAASAGLPLDEPAVAAARSMNDARASSDFTRFDGNLAGQEGLPDLMAGEWAISATALERYAICPHEYFVSRMLRVSPVEEPEETLDISAMDFGNLIHESFDVFIRGASERGELPGYGQPWTEAQRQQLLGIGAEHAVQYEADGRTGHPLLWSRTRIQILAVLSWMIDDDNRWRSEQDARVVASELAFGVNGEAPVDVAVEGGVVRIRGYADKVDQRRDGTLLVTDIKTGSQRTFKGLSEVDPVHRGEKLQLPVYAHAVRARFGDRSSDVEAMYWFVRRDRGRIEVPLTEQVQSTYAGTIGLLAGAIARGAFPSRAPEVPDFRWVQCAYCNPDGLGHGAVRAQWEAKRLVAELVDYTGLVEPGAVSVPADHAHETEDGQ